MAQDASNIPKTSACTTPTSPVFDIAWVLVNWFHKKFKTFYLPPHYVACYIKISKRIF
jgi:hypothetical protein